MLCLRELQAADPDAQSAREKELAKEAAAKTCFVKTPEDLKNWVILIWCGDF